MDPQKKDMFIRHTSHLVRFFFIFWALWES